MAEVFISYSQNDRDWVKRLAAALEAERLWVWWDVALRTGEKYRDVIDREIEAAPAIVVVWSEHSIKSDWVLGEADDARRQGKFLPVLKENVAIPREFRAHQAADLSNWQGEPENAAFRNVVNAIRALQSGQAPKPGAETVPGKKPAPLETSVREQQSSAELRFRNRRTDHGERRKPPEPNDEPKSRPALPPVEVAPEQPTENGSERASFPRWAIYAAVVLLVIGGAWLAIGRSALPSQHDVQPSADDLAIAQAEHVAAEARETAENAEAAEKSGMDEYTRAANLGRGFVPLQLPNAKYSGQSDNGIPQGLGLKVFVPPAKCQARPLGDIQDPQGGGDWTRGAMDGLGAQTNCKGYVYEGHFGTGRPQGLGVSVAPDGTIYSGAFDKGSPTLGSLKSGPPNLAREEDGAMADSGLNGAGIVLCVNGARWEGSWIHGARNGFARKYSPDNKIREQGTYKWDPALDRPDPTNARLCATP
jgi:hypothetical protein